MPWCASSQSAHAPPRPSRTLYGTRVAGRALAPSGLPYSRCGCAVASPETVARTAIACEPVRCSRRPAVPRGCHCPRLPSSAAAGRPWAQRRKPPRRAAVVVVGWALQRRAAQGALALYVCCRHSVHLAFGVLGEPGCVETPIRPTCSDRQQSVGRAHMAPGAGRGEPHRREDEHIRLTVAVQIERNLNLARRGQ